jgi:hypothetical protein
MTAQLMKRTIFIMFAAFGVAHAGEQPQPKPNLHRSHAVHQGESPVLFPFLEKDLGGCSKPPPFSFLHRLT